MTKIEIICESCDSHYIIVTKDDDKEVSFCPFCSATLDVTDQEGDDE